MPSSKLCLPWVKEILDATSVVPVIIMKQMGNLLYPKKMKMRHIYLQLVLQIDAACAEQAC